MRVLLTLSPKFGPGIWLDRRLVARVVATVEDSRITEDEPVPRWRRDAEALVDAANRGFAAADNQSPEPARDASGAIRILDEVIGYLGHGIYGPHNHVPELRAVRAALALPGEALDVGRLRAAALDVEAGYILKPDRTRTAYWRKIANRYAYLSPTTETTE